MKPHRTAAVAFTILAYATAGWAQAGPTPRQLAGGSASPTVQVGTRTVTVGVVEGTAVDSTNRALPERPVRLRDARTGRVVAARTTDKTGLFAFKDVDPGTYIVELTDDQRVIAASQLLHVDPGTAVSTVVKLPFRAPPLGGLLGHSVSQALAITAAAAASGVLAANVTGEDVSPR